MGEMENEVGLLKYLYGIVELRESWFDENLMEMELSFLYAERYKQSVRYEGVYYFDPAIRQKGLYIGIAEELPLSALLESRFNRPLYRFCNSIGQLNEGYLEALSAKGGKLFVNHGKTDDYIVVARRVAVREVGA